MKQKFVSRNLRVVTLVVAAPRTWVLKTAKRHWRLCFFWHDHTRRQKPAATNCFLKIADLATNDQATLPKSKPIKKQAQLDAEAAQMRAAAR